MTDTTPDNRCYRHPDRESYIRCQRCGRTICPECQTIAPVGVHCPECVREARQSGASGPSIVTRATRVMGPMSRRPVVTYFIIAVCLMVYAAQYLTGNTITALAQYAPSQTAAEPWRMITAIFVHGSVLHVLLNMYSLYIVGPALEAMLGRLRYFALFMIAGFGGSVGVLLIAPAGESVVGASGAIFGLFGAYFIIQRRLGGNASQMLILIAINLVFGFVVPGIAWQAHVGGLLSGAAVAFIYAETRRRDQRGVQVALVAAVAVLVLLAIVKVAFFQ